MLTSRGGEFFSKGYSIQNNEIAKPIFWTLGKQAFWATSPERELGMSPD